MRRILLAAPLTLLAATGCQAPLDAPAALAVASAVSLSTDPDTTGRPPEPLGLGIAVVQVEPGVRFGLYEAPDDAEPLATVELVADTASHTVALAPSAPAWLRPEVLWLDYGVLTFRVLRVTEAGKEVIVDGEAGRTAWLRAHPAVEFAPWPRYLVEFATSIDRLDADANPIRSAPDPAAPGVPYPRGDWDCFAAVEVRGEWARVRTSELCAYEGSEVPLLDDGWIRWTDGERLLVAYGTSC